MGTLRTPNNATSTTNVSMVPLLKNFALMGWSLMTTVPNMKNAIYLLILIAVLDLNYVRVTENKVVLVDKKTFFLEYAEEPQPSEHCPRKNGYFAHEQKNICDKFYYCVDGKFNMIICPNGLVYNENAGICSWPDEAKRKGCTSEGHYLL